MNQGVSLSGDDQDPLDSPDDVETEKQNEGPEPDASPDDAGVNGDD
ncbi:hypothetical protein LCGC14_0192060 [marine sediment metagenome]|uniref:Uncharacterized protein n=1 Tax=marine sediment metagenome TaxID=412755 RepID=A0A0F9XNV9_9ZZZZ